LRFHYLFMLFSALLLFPLSAAANPVISCHCFQDRSFDPTRPDAVDPYLLATTQNSLMAASFALVKRDLVKAKMTGTSGDALWVAHYLATRSDQNASRLMSNYGRTGSWQATVTALKIPKGNLDLRFAALLAGNADGEVLAAAIADEMVTTLLGADPTAVERIRFRGGATPEIILATFLGRKSNRSPVDLYGDVTAGRTSWGEILDGLGMAPGSIEEEIRGLVKSP
jgi:hypothetical protein